MKKHPLDLGISSDLEVIDRFLTLKGSFLVDAGCGDMSLSRELAARGAAVLAIDPDPVQAEINRQSATIANVGFTQTGAQDVPVENASVDGVVFRYSLHHVPHASLSDVFGEMIRILKPEGFLYIIEPVAAGDLNEIMRLFHDEQIVRELAQQAIDQYASPAFAEQQIVDYRVPIKFDSWDHFADNYAVKSYNCGYTKEDVHSSEVQDLFQRLGAPTNFCFESPVRVTYLQNPVRLL